ncbi:hypothetical protein EKK58_06840 [Candidatus Dependentiae bacterium]|nr:MAG: hypothetical protein EKK58_06840 [Candidatus Dependentiae bacterium]
MRYNIGVIKKIVLTIFASALFMPILSNASQSNYHIPLIERVGINSGLAAFGFSVCSVVYNIFTGAPFMENADFLFYALPTLANIRINHMAKFRIFGLQNIMNILYIMLLTGKMYGTIEQGNVKSVPFMVDLVCLIPPTTFLYSIVKWHYHL